MNGSLLRLVAATALLGLLPGCASLSKKECLAADWEDVGVRDGANGRGEEYLIQHSTACARVGVTPDRERWQRGRERGLERFCVPHNAYRIGEYGGSFSSAVCRNFDESRLIDAYEKGRDVYRLQDELNGIDNEMREINDKLEKDKELEKKERERLAFRLGVLTVQRIDAQRSLEDARYRARDL